ncbi:uncharacterized protein N7459_007703 [Penicillium hispanicum]|uniref:uncharacterized protein n=1 Tax=Penicillium hispanicum TaxID=1080232 RepID=UPI0025402785|nr:uncharacterized protein N7459_007703 [Penicillium hispanicum]KAJ5578739.1 hypothetical protein N7459_007703 [Penicillium hispanicum]
MSSDSSTAGSHAYSSDLEESIFLQRNRSIHWGRLALSCLISAAAITVIACEAVPFRHYMTTAEWASTGLTLWPQNFDLRPTVAALSCGCVIAFMNLIYVVAALLPSPHSRIKLLNICASASALAGFITSLVGILFIIYLPSSTYPTGFTKNETLHSWTCKWKKDTGHDTTPVHFVRDCHNTRAGFALLCTLLGLEILMGIGAVVGAWFQRDVGRRREEQVQLEKLEIATKQVYRN